MAGKVEWKVIWFTPHPSLDLTFQDLAPALLDLPFELEDIWVHVHEDSFAKQLDRFEYKFAVSAGELVIGVPANLPKDRAPSREREALHEAYEVARGRGTTRTRIVRILLTTKTSREWNKVPTLRAAPRAFRECEVGSSYRNRALRSEGVKPGAPTPRGRSLEEPSEAVAPRVIAASGAIARA